MHPAQPEQAFSAGQCSGLSDTPKPAAPDQPVRGVPARSQLVYWIIAALLALIAVALWLKPAGSLLPAALAQQQPLAGARGIFAFTGPIERDQYGLFMLDVDQGTIWCYAFENQGGTAKLRLVAARTWVYDRYLQDFNCAAPDFRTVQKLVAAQRAQAANSPDVPGEPAPEKPVPGNAAPDQSAPGNALPDQKGLKPPG